MADPGQVPPSPAPPDPIDDPHPVQPSSADTGETGATPSEGDTPPQKKSFFSRFKKENSPDDDKKEKDSDDDDKPPPVMYRELFTYATRNEKIMMLIAFLSAMGHGSLMPIFTILFGGIIDNFGELDDVDGIALSEITAAIGDVAKWFLLLACIAFVTSLIQVRLQLIVAQRVGARLRRKFFESLMSQDYTWIDQNDGGELTARVAGDVNLVQAGIGDKFTSAVQFISMFFVGIIVAFVYGPLLTLVILTVAPLLIIGGAVFAKMAADSTGDGVGAYGSAGAIANEVIGLIRVVTAYNGQESETKRYEKELDKAYKADVKKAMWVGFGMGFTFFVMFCAYGIAFAFGAWRVRTGNIMVMMNPGDVLTTFFSVIIACFSIGQGTCSLFVSDPVLARSQSRCNRLVSMVLIY